MRRLPAALLAAAFAAGFAHAAVTSPTPAPRAVLEVFEDGSGVERVNGRTVRVFDAGTYSWHCESDGNRVCGMPGESRP